MIRLIQHRNEEGFSLVEALVAGGVMALSVVALVVFVRKGQEMLAIDKHRRMARGIIERTLENNQYQPENYNNLVATLATPLATDVVIDEDMEPDPQGLLTQSIGTEQHRVYNTDTVPYREVTATVTWTEPGRINDTVSIVKWLTNVQRE
jgi:Tfp pilus assembly protein PilV